MAFPFRIAIGAGTAYIPKAAPFFRGGAVPKYIDLVGMNTSNGAQAQIWNFVSGGNQEWNLERVDSTVQQTRAKAEEAHDPEPTPSQRKHQNDLVRKLNNAGKGRAGRKA